MKIRNLVFAVFAVVVFGSSGVMAGTTGVFQWPVSPISAYAPEDFHMAFYDDPNLLGYHMGEDWNANDGSDETSDPLYALTNGYVVYVDNAGTVVPSKGKIIIVRYTLPNGDTVDSAYYHCNTIVVNLHDYVVPDQKIAEIGKTGTFNPHLHWQMETDPDLSPSVNPYHGEQLEGGPARDPMTPANALRYTSPSLFVDDRSQTESKPITSSGTWTFFYVNDYAPSSTAHLDVGDGDLYSIDRAVSANLISSYGVIYQKSDGTWWFYNNVMNIHFEPGTQYAIWLNNGTGTFNVVPPANNYKDDRARIDMVRVANEDSRYNVPVTAKNNVRVELFASYNTSDPTYYYRKMAFMFKRADGTEGGAYFNHATLKTNPLIRYVCKYLIDTGTWTWVQMDRNSLY